jgi:hypothetical protein
VKLPLREGLPARRFDLWIHQAKDEIAVLDPLTGSVHLLNATALAIWDLCDGETKPEEMVDAICQVSGLHEDVVIEDVCRVLQGFDQAGMVTWRV